MSLQCRIHVQPSFQMKTRLLTFQCFGIHDSTKLVSTKMPGHGRGFFNTSTELSTRDLKYGREKLVHAATPLGCRSAALPLRFHIDVVSISLCGTSCLSFLVSLRKLWTLSLAILASSSGVVSLTTTVSRLSGLSLIPHFPLAW